MSVLLLTGMGVGLLYDLLRAFRGQLVPGPIGSLLLDLAFWFGVTIFTLTGLLLGNWGEMRFYVLLVVAGGALLYLSLASYVVLPLLSGLLAALGRLSAFLFRVVSEPVRRLWQGLGAGWRCIRGDMARLGCWIGKQLARCKKKKGE